MPNFVQGLENITPEILSKISKVDDLMVPSTSNYVINYPS